MAACHADAQNGAASFGSTLKVEERRVLPHDVQVS
jgi:predicted NUDIX family phosphoesterase